MSTARIEKLFVKIKDASDKLDALYLEKRQTIEQLSDCYSNVNKLKEEKTTVLALSNSLKRDLNNYYERVKTYQEWKKRQTAESSILIAEKNIAILEQSISNTKAKLTIYEEKISNIQPKLDEIFLQIKELKIEKHRIFDDIKALKQKKDEYKNSIDNIKAKHKIKR